MEIKLENLVVPAIGALLASIAWLIKRHFSRIDDHETRVQSIEVKIPTLATRDDVTKVRERVESKVDHLREDFYEQTNRIITHIGKGGKDGT